MPLKTPPIERNGRKWKVWVIDETDVTVTVRVRPLRARKNPTEYTFPFRREFSSFGVLANEAIERYFDEQANAARRHPHGQI